MTDILTAAWNSDAAVDLTLHPLPSPLENLTRLDANGLHPVRLEDGTTPSGDMVITDYEANLADQVTYQATLTQPVEVRRNLFSNPGMTSIKLVDAWSGNSGNARTVEVVESQFAKSGKAVRSTWTAHPNADGNVGPIAQLANGTPGIGDLDQRTIVWKARCSKPGADLTGFPATGSSNETMKVDAAAGRQSPDQNGVYTFYVTFTPKVAGGYPTSTRVDTGNDLGVTTPIWIEIFDVDFYAGPYDPNREWFSGSYSPDSEREPVWVGEADASQSVLVQSRFSVEVGASGVDRPCIHAVTDPVRRFRPVSITSWQADREWGGEVYEIIRSEYPRVVAGARRSRSTVIELVCDSLSQVAELEAALQYGTTYMARMPEHASGDLYFIPRSSSLRTHTASGGQTVWVLSLTVREVSWPAGPIRSSVGRSYGDDLALALTYADSLTQRPTYSDRQAMRTQ